MSKPVATGPRLITVGIALAAVSAALFVVPRNAVAEMFVDRAELDDDEGLRVEGEDAVPFAIVRVTSAQSSASSPADDDGRFRVLSLEFRSSNCRAMVTDGVTTVQVVLDECTPTTPTTPPPTTTRLPRHRPRPPRRHDDGTSRDHHHHNHNDNHDHDDDTASDHHDHDCTADDHDDHCTNDHDDNDDDRADGSIDVQRSARQRAVSLLHRRAEHGER